MTKRKKGRNKERDSKEKISSTEFPEGRASIWKSPCHPQGKQLKTYLWSIKWICYRWWKHFLSLHLQLLQTVNTIGVFSSFLRTSCYRLSYSPNLSLIYSFTLFWRCKTILNYMILKDHSQTHVCNIDVGMLLQKLMLTNFHISE